MSDNTLTRENQFYAEIAALRAEVALVRVENKRVRSDIDRIRVEVEQRTAERDEARRDACVFEARYQEVRNCPLDIPSEHWIQGDAKRIAIERGWDCFDAKEGKP